MCQWDHVVLPPQLLDPIHPTVEMTSNQSAAGIGIGDRDYCYSHSVDYENAKRNVETLVTPTRKFPSWVHVRDEWMRLHNILFDSLLHHHSEWR